MLIQLAEQVTYLGGLSTLISLGLIVLPWLHRLFSHDRFYMGDMEYALALTSSLVCHGIALLLYVVAKAPSDTRGRRISIVSLLLTVATLCPPVFGVVGLLLANYSNPKPPTRFGSCHRYQFYLTYGLATLGLVLMLAPCFPLLRQTLHIGENTDVIPVLMAGTLCATTALFLARSLGMERMRAAVVLAWLDLSFWLLGHLLCNGRYF